MRVIFNGGLFLGVVVIVVELFRYFVAACCMQILDGFWLVVVFECVVLDRGKALRLLWCSVVMGEDGTNACFFG